MIWELIATVIAGLGAAGLVLALRLFIKTLPKSFIPAGAGLGMLFFQIYSEYTWFEHTRSRLPESAVVVAEVAESAFYKPWSYYRAPVLKFITVDKATTISQPQNQHIKETHLYFFERRINAHTLPILIDCHTRLQANLPANANLAQAPQWGQTPYTSKVVAALCTPG